MSFESINLGPISISLYSICILVGIIFATIIICKEAKKCNIPTYFMTNLIFWVIIFGILGARTYYVIFNLDYYMDDPIEIIKIWNGGLAIHGGMIAGFLTVFIYCKKYKIKLLKMLDILLPGVIIAQAIGRWGNFFNGEAHGGFVSRSFLENLHLPDFIIEGMYIDGDYCHPTFLYESFFCLIGFILLIGVRNTKGTKTGNISGFYFIWYGIVRFFVESLRTDSLMLGDIKVAQLVSILMVIGGIVLFTLTKIKGNNYDEDKISEKDIKI